MNRFLGKKGGTAGAGKLLTGLFLALTVLQPLSSVNMDMLESLTFDIETEATLAVRLGEEESRNAVAQIIKDRTAAYILQKAEGLQVEIIAEVVVSDDTVPVPEKVYLSGTIAPYAKQQLQTMIEKELGIAKENQIWT